MSSILSLCWIKRNVAKTPARIKLERDELEKIFREKKVKKSKKTKPKKSDDGDRDNDGDRDVDEKYNLDAYDDEDSDIRADTLSQLACFPSNADDDLLMIKDEGEDSDQEDFLIKSTDNILISGQVDDEVCTLNAFVYNNVEHSYYIHHDIILPSYPICVEWLDYDSTMDENNNLVNYLAIGSLNPWVEIWDLDVMDCLEPEFILGSPKSKKKKEKMEGHKKAVLDLSWNKINRNILASASADKSIILWDLDELKMATQIKRQASKIQSIKFHPLETFSLLSGSFDQSVCLYDCRNPDANYKMWNFENGEIEKVLWNHNSSNYFLATTDQGYIYIADIRQDKPLLVQKIHDSSVTGLTLSSTVPNLLCTASSDEFVKIWDIDNNQTLTFVDQKDFGVGPITCAQASPDSPFVFAFGGEESTEPAVWDVRDSKAVRTQFYARMGIDQEEEEAAAEKEEERKRERRMKRVKNDKGLETVKGKNAKKKQKQGFKDSKGNKKLKTSKNGQNSDRNK